MKNIIFFLFFTASAFGQNVTFDTSYIVPMGEKFLRHSEVIYEDGRKVVEDAPMDSLEVARVYTNDVYNIANQVSDAAIKGMDRRRALNLIAAKRSKILSVSGADIADSIAIPIMKKISNLEWIATGIDTIPIAVDFKKTSKKNQLVIGGKKFDVLILSEKWIHVIDLYGKGKSEDFFLYGGSYVASNYGIILSVKAIKKDRNLQAPTQVRSSRSTRKPTKE